MSEGLPINGLAGADQPAQSAQPVPSEALAASSRILAIGGHEFDRRSGNDALSELIVEQAGGPGSRVCLLPTAGGDSEEQIRRFRLAIGERGCEPSVVSLFRRGDHQLDLREVLLSQDAIYVGGGSLVNLLAIWRVHGIDPIIREAHERGIFLCGQSAGAMIFFERGITTSHGTPAVAPGLGILPGAASVHYHSEPERRRVLLAEVAGGLAGGFGLDDQAALLFAGGQEPEAISAREGAGAWRVQRDPGSPEQAPGWCATERLLRARRLFDLQPAINGASAEIIELRRTLAVRRGAGRRLGSPRVPG